MKITVSKDYENTRLDNFIKKQFEDLTLNDICIMIDSNKILINGELLDKKYRVQKNDIIDILYEESELPNFKSFISLSEEEIQFIKDSIVFENENFVIFNKNPKYIVHDNRGHNNGLVDMLKAYTKNLNFCFVNRIDRDTSGLIIGSKSLETTRDLSAEIKNRQVDKQYYILVNGVPAEDTFTIKSYLKKLSRKVIEVDKDEEGGKESISHFEVIKRGKSRTILRGILETGRTHQLRVHLANYGMPIVGDKKYGFNDKEEIMHLFSHKIIINKYNFVIDLDYPEYFNENLEICKERF